MCVSRRPPSHYRLRWRRGKTVPGESDLLIEQRFVHVSLHRPRIHSFGAIISVTDSLLYIQWNFSRGTFPAVTWFASTTGSKTTKVSIVFQRDDKQYQERSNPNHKIIFRSFSCSVAAASSRAHRMNQLQELKTILCIFIILRLLSFCFKCYI